MRPFVTAGAGFLLAVLWFDLMFDVQVVRHRGRELPEPVLVSIAGYYRRVTTAARLGSRADPAPRQAALARAVCRDHVACFAAIASLLAVELAAG